MVVNASGLPAASRGNFGRDRDGDRSTPFVAVVAPARFVEATFVRREIHACIRAKSTTPTATAQTPSSTCLAARLPL
jgi:hypothetical protein